MKISRLIAYAAGGIIVGLLAENKTLLFKQAAENQSRRAKKKLDKLAHKVTGR